MVRREILRRGYIVLVKQSHAALNGGIVKRDLRDPQSLGETLVRMRELYPDMSASDRADLLEQISSLTTNGDPYLQPLSNGK